MKNAIINGDSLEEMKKLETGSIDLIFADPPYWMRTNGNLYRINGDKYNGVRDYWDNQFRSLEDYKQFTEVWLKEARRLLKKNGTIWVIGSMQCIYTVGGLMQDLGFWFINDVVWKKSNPTPNFRGSRIVNAHEILIWAKKNKSSSFTFNYQTAKKLNGSTHANSNDSDRARLKQMQSVWELSVCSGHERLKNEKGDKLHSTQKPQELLKRVIAIASKPGDRVLDPFAGTMTTGAVAKRMGRQYIMIERDKTYYEKGKERIENTTEIMNGIAKADADRKKTRVKIEDMIHAGYLFLGEKLYDRHRVSHGTLTAKGKILHEDEELSIHELAGKIKKMASGRANGYDFWFVERNTELVSIDKIREDYRKALT